MSEEMEWMCQCDSWSCRKGIILTLDELMKIADRDLIIIVDGCEKGPPPTEELVEKREGYSLYRAVVEEE